MVPELTTEEFSAALDSVAAEVLSVLDDVEPPIDALRLAGKLGVAVAWDTQQQGRGRVVQLRGFAGTAPHGSILLRPDPRRERLQWAIAHEIGELCAVQVFDRLSVDPREAPPGARERVANLLAGRLLLPKETFREDGRSCGWDLIVLKARYSTASHELIARRMLDFSCGAIITIFDHGQQSFRRGNLTGALPPLMPTELAAWREAHESGIPTASADPCCRVQAWPVHEPQWKREILRTEWQPPDDFD